MPEYRHVFAVVGGVEHDVDSEALACEVAASL